MDQGHLYKVFIAFQIYLSHVEVYDISNPAKPESLALLLTPTNEPFYDEDGVDLFAVDDYLTNGSRARGA